MGHGAAGLGVVSIAQLMCFYTNACRVSHTLEELAAIVQQESHDIVSLTEMCWDDLWAGVLQ